MIARHFSRIPGKRRGNELFISEWNYLQWIVEEDMIAIYFLCALLSHEDMLRLKRSMLYIYEVSNLMPKTFVSK